VSVNRGSVLAPRKLVVDGTTNKCEVAFCPTATTACPAAGTSFSPIRYCPCLHWPADGQGS
jgi:hypothetical protein